MTYTNLKVAFLHPRLEGGGAERVSLTTAKLFVSWGIKIYFIGAVHHPEQFVVPEALGATIHCLPESGDFHTETNKVALRDYIDAEGINIAFVCYLDGDFFRNRIGTKSCKFAYWCHANPFWEHLYAVERGEMQAKYSIRKWAEWHLLGNKRDTKSKEAYARVVAGYARDLEIFDSYIALCPEYKEELREVLDLTPALYDRITPLINTIDIEPEPNLAKKKEIALVGRVELVQKRFDRMLLVWSKIMHQLPDWTLKIYGTGHDVWLAHRLIKKLRLERVEYCGYVTDLGKIYNDSAVVCLTSTFEGWPMVFAEAQNNGCIPIAFDCCAGIHSIIGDNEAGRLIAPYDISAYASALREICKDENLRLKLQARCLKKRLDYHPHINDEAWHRLLSELSPSGLSPRAYLYTQAIRGKPIWFATDRLRVAE